MHGESFFHQAFVYLSAAVVSVPLAQRLGLGSVLGYLIAGVAIGPFALGLIGQEGQNVMEFAEFGVVMMLFLVGLELQPRRVWRLRTAILGLGGSQVLLTTLVITSVAMAFGLAWQTALAVGLTLSLSSTAIVLQTLAEKGLMKTAGGQNAFSTLLFQDLAVIPMLAILPLLAIGGADGVSETAHTPGGWIEALPRWGRTVVVLGAVGAIVASGQFLVRPVLRFIAKSGLREIFTAAGLLLVIGIALLMEQVGLSPALGTFIAGVVLAESEYRHELEADVEPFKGLLLGLFFIAVGASINFNLIGAQPYTVLGLVVGLVVVKFAVLIVLGRVFRMGFDQSLLLAFSLAQGGEFAFVLFSFATQNGVLDTQTTGPLIAVVALSMAATPLLMLVNERFVQPRFGTRERQKRDSDVVDEDSRVIVAGFGRFGNVVGRLLTANGVQTTVLDLDSDRVDILRRLGLKVFYGDATRSDLLHAAGAERAELLILAMDEPDEIRRLVHTAREHFPNLRILARAFDRRDAYDLLEDGVNNVYRDTLDTSLRMGVDALRMLGFRAHQAHRAALKFRCYDEASIQELATIRHDTVKYFSVARQRIADLEQMLRADIEDAIKDVDSGWDADSLIEDFKNIKM